MLVTSIFSVSHNVFKRLLIQSRKISVLCGKGFKKIDFNSLRNDRILELSELKAFADDKIIDMNLKFLFERLENIVGKGENAGYQHFLLFLQCFQKASSSRSLKVDVVWNKI